MSRRDAWHVADWSSKASPDIGSGPVLGNVKEHSLVDGSEARLPRQSTWTLLKNQFPQDAHLGEDGHVARGATEVDHANVDPQADCLLQADE